MAFGAAAKATAERTLRAVWAAASVRPVAMTNPIATAFQPKAVREPIRHWLDQLPRLPQRHLRLKDGRLILDVRANENEVVPVVVEV